MLSNDLIADSFRIIERTPFDTNICHVSKRDIRPGWIGNTPIGNISDYKKAWVYFEGTDLCPMRGSKRGIAAANGTRVYEYEYYFAYWLGARFAKFYQRTGKHYLFINTKRPLHERMQWNAHHCFLESFAYGFSSVLPGSKAEIIRRKEMRKGELIDASSICLFTYEGIEEEKIKPIREALFSACDIELINSLLRK